MMVHFAPQNTHPEADKPVVGDDGYRVAFYEMAEMLELPAMPLSPAEVWRSFMRPMLRARKAARWRSMDTAPRDQVIIAMARYRDATAGSPSFVAFIDGEWREMGRTIMEPMVCWAWMPRDVLGDWPLEITQHPPKRRMGMEPRQRRNAPRTIPMTYNTSMLERMARAYWRREGETDASFEASWAAGGREAAIEASRAALLAIKEPSEAVLVAMGGWSDDAEVVWPAMIDAILNGEA